MMQGHLNYKFCNFEEFPMEKSVDSTNAFSLHNARLLRPGVGVALGSLSVRDGRVEDSTSTEVEESSLDAGGRLLTPGLIDMHAHGVHTHCYENGPDELLSASAILTRYGVTGVMATVVPRIDEGYLALLSALASALPNASGASILGIHLEGPFVAYSGAACKTSPGDVKMLDDLLDACEQQARVMTLSPEVPDVIPVIERCLERGVVPFISHTRASVEQCLAAMDAGARHAGHFYDVFPVPEETDPGVRPVGAVETVLGDARGSCDFICDGIHVHPMAIRAAVAAKGWQGVSLITDASFGAGLAAGEYDTPWGYPVRIEPGGAPRIASVGHPMNGGLAGSALTMDVGMRNLSEWLNLPVEQVWAMGTRNPATVLGLDGKGILEPGADADLVLWDEADGELRAHKTWVAGKCVYDADMA
jgi:N-acetylglucosamine-6-phosphate deacetylase